MGLSFGNLLVILAIVLIVFGAGKLPRVMGDLGKSLRSFRDGLTDEDENENKTKKKQISKKNKPKKILISNRTNIVKKNKTEIKPSKNSNKKVKIMNTRNVK